jgi:hypothetical protein
VPPVVCHSDLLKKVCHSVMTFPYAVTVVPQFADLAVVLADFDKVAVRVPKNIVRSWLPGHRFA